MDTALQIQSKLTPGTNKEKSWLLDYLPGLYAEDPFSPEGPFLDRFLRIFESIWDPLDQKLNILYAFFDPRLAPTEFLPWLATWVDLVLDENWEEPRRRELLMHAAELYRRRGTAGELRDYLRICTGVEPQIFEDVDPRLFEGLDPPHFEEVDPLRKYLKQCTSIAPQDYDQIRNQWPFHFSVVFVAENAASLDKLTQHEDRIRRIIQEEKPAHTIYTLYILGKK